MSSWRLIKKPWTRNKPLRMRLPAANAVLAWLTVSFQLLDRRKAVGQMPLLSSLKTWKSSMVMHYLHLPSYLTLDHSASTSVIKSWTKTSFSSSGTTRFHCHLLVTLSSFWLTKLRLPHGIIKSYHRTVSQLRTAQSSPTQRGTHLLSTLNFKVSVGSKSEKKKVTLRLLASQTPRWSKFWSLP